MKVTVVGVFMDPCFRKVCVGILPWLYGSCVFYEGRIEY